MTPADLPEPLRGRLALKTGEVARLIGCSSATVRALAAAGRLRSVEVGLGASSKTRVIPVSAVLEFLGDQAPGEARR